MVLWLLWMLLSPSSSAELVLGLAVVAAALLVAVTATGLPMLGGTVARTGPTTAARRRRRIPRLLDPDAAGRPRSRAPAYDPATA